MSPTGALNTPTRIKVQGIVRLSSEPPHTYGHFSRRTPTAGSRPLNIRNLRTSKYCSSTLRTGCYGAQTLAQSRGETDSKDAVVRILLNAEQNIPTRGPLLSIPVTATCFQAFRLEQISLFIIAVMVDRPTSFRHSSISSKDMSCPQAYNINDDLSLHEANPIPLEGEQNHRSTSTVGDYATKTQDGPYKPGKWLYLAFATLAILTIMVALDATALSVALPVSSFHSPTCKPGTLNKPSDYCQRAPRDRPRGFLGRNFIPSRLNRFSAHNCSSLQCFWEEMDHNYGSGFLPSRCYHGRISKKFRPPPGGQNSPGYWWWRHHCPDTGYHL